MKHAILRAAMTALPRLLPLRQALSLTTASTRPFSSTSTAHTSTERARNIAAYMRDKADRMHSKKIGMMNTPFVVRSWILSGVAEKIQHAQEAKQEQKADDQKMIEGDISEKKEMSARRSIRRRRRMRRRGWKGGGRVEVRSKRYGSTCPRVGVLEEE
jgi:hypothetical protein